ncbi:phosphatidate cytidylyltransferase [Bacteroidia bacterium]|nr:phosphatidate cytidylyltransferase [Bacteroidia bacterium]
MRSKILTRALSGTVFVAIMLSVIYFGSITFALFMAFVMLVALIEFYSIAHKLSVAPQRFTGFAMAVVLFFASYAKAFKLFDAAVADALLYAAIPLAMLAFIMQLYRKSAHPFSDLAYTFLGVVYITLPLMLMNFVYAKGGAALIFCYFLLLWANDTFAYLVGIAIGKHRLFPRHSPKKSWEGYVGGICSVALSSYILNLVFPEIALSHIAIIGLIIATTATLGDLVESMLKREAGIKDAGKIMPGHGGFLDRFDVALLSFPLVFVYVQLFF